MISASRLPQIQNPLKELPPILVVGERVPTSLSEFFTFQGQSIELQRAVVEDLFLFIGKKLFSCVVVFADGLTEAHWAAIENFKKQAPHISLILVSAKIDEHFISKGINRMGALAFVNLGKIDSEFGEALQLALNNYLILSSRYFLTKESVQQNRELEALTSSLEELVEERTQHIKISNEELSEKLAKERQIIRFIKDVAVQLSVEDLLQVLRREFKKFHKTGEPILVYRQKGGWAQIATFSASRFTQGSAPFEWPSGELTSEVKKNLMVNLATLLGRPLAKASLFPIESQLEGHAGSSIVAYLCIENSLGGDELSLLMETVQDRLQPLGMALDRILLERNLEQFSFRWAKTFDAVKDPIAIIDLDFNVIMANRNFSLHGEDKKCYQIFANRQTTCEGCPLKETLKKETPIEHSLTLEKKSFRLFSYPVRAQEGSRVTTVVHQYMDITEERELYLQYIQNEKMGALGALAGNIAHELNNPLTGILSLIQVLKNEVPSDEAQLKTDLVEIEKATKRSQKIIANLLDFAKGSDQITERISVDEIVEKTLPMLKTAMRMHRLRLNLNSKGFLVNVEPHLIQQAIFNLVNNACQAMKDVGDLTIATQVERDSVHLVIEDTGPGIPKDILEKIFLPFFTTKSEGQGTGLGLSLVRSIVEKFNGHIQVENVSSGGARFVVVLPASKD